MSYRVLREVVSPVRKRIDLEDWEPSELPGFPVTVRSDKGQETVRAFLARTYNNVEVHLVLEVEGRGMEMHRDYVFRVW